LLGQGYENKGYSASMNSNTRDNISWSSVTAVCSVVIASCALFVTVWQINETREHNRLSVLPSLNIYHTGETDGGDRGWVVENTGLGPAIIGNSVILVDGKPVEGGISWTAWREVAKRLSISKEHVTLSGLDYKEVVQHGSEFPLIAIKNHIDKQKAGYALYALYEKVRVEICYCSFYGECRVLVVHGNDRKEALVVHGDEITEALVCEESIRLDK
jgi:hypothetical protein